MATEVVLETTMGQITLELYTPQTPNTVSNFTTLVRRNYYTNIPIHRIIPNFMIQTGDPTGTGRGGQSASGQPFADEITSPPTLRHTGAGVVSMANSGPDTNGSQFFVTLAPAPWLDGKHTVFGRVRRGMGVVRRLGLVRTDKEDRPVEDVRVLRAWVVESGEGE